MINHTLLAGIAIIPLLVIFYTGYVRVWVWMQVMPITCVITAFIAFLIWQVPFLTVFASFFQGLTLSLQHIFFLISILFFTEVLRATGSLNTVKVFFNHISPDRRIQAIVVAWFFAAFVEGLMGFAFTGAICAVLLMGMGFPPACAILLGIIGPVTANTFSCVGTPILFHASQGLNDPAIFSQIALTGKSFSEYLQLITSYIGMISGMIGTLIPLAMMLMMSRFYGAKRSWKDALAIAPFALFCGFAFTIPYALTAIFLGPQFPSLFGAVVGFALMLIAHHFKFLIPKEKWDFEPFEKWEPAWYEGHYEKNTEQPTLSWRKAWVPFLLLFVALLLVQWPHSPVNNFLKNYSFQKENFLGTPIQLSFHPFFMPATLILFSVSFLTLAIHKFQHVEKVFNQRLSIFVSKAFLSLPFIMPIAAIYFNSGLNNSGYPSMYAVIAQQMTQLPIPNIFHFLMTPFVSGFVTDVSSSGMHSIMLISSYQFYLGQSLIGNGALFVAMHIVAATAANMFAGHYLNGVSIYAGKEGLTGPIGRLAMRPLVIYLILIGCVAFAVAKIA